MSTEHLDKGHALEQAVKFIQEHILESSPELKGGNFTVESNVRDTSSGVLHEIDVLVKTHPGTDYESVWIFECKNWSKPVDKNEVIVLAEKVDALKATKGFLVAKSLTSHAQAQLEKSGRLEFVRCSEDFLSPIINIQIVYQTTEPLPIVLQIQDRNLSAPPHLTASDWKKLGCRLNGRPLDFESYINRFVNDMIRDDAKHNLNRYRNAGTHWSQFTMEMCFSKGELMIGHMDIENILIPLRLFVTVRRQKMLSKFELEGRGRSYSFEPIEDLEDGRTLEFHMVQRLKRNP